MRKALSFFSALTILLGATSVAQAGSISVDGVGDQFVVNFNGSDENINSSVDTWLTASVLFYVQSYGAQSLVLKGTVSNTTQAPYTSRVTGLGFDLNPDASGASVTGVFATALSGAFQPHGIADTFDVCVKNGQPNNCHASQGGVAQGSTGDFFLTLTFASNISSGVSFDNFVVRYQGIGYPAGESGSGSGAGRGCIVGVDTTGLCEPDGGDKPVPEPTTMALLGIGLLGASIAARRRR